jgi:hypothetical protein
MPSQIFSNVHPGYWLGGLRVGGPELERRALRFTQFTGFAALASGPSLTF